jgi:hypothetical protein
VQRLIGSSQSRARATPSLFLRLHLPRLARTAGLLERPAPPDVGDHQAVWDSLKTELFHPAVLLYAVEKALAKAQETETRDTGQESALQGQLHTVEQELARLSTAIASVAISDTPHRHPGARIAPDTALTDAEHVGGGPHTSDASTCGCSTGSYAPRLLSGRGCSTH